VASKEAEAVAEDQDPLTPVQQSVKHQAMETSHNVATVKPLPTIATKTGNVPHGATVTTTSKYELVMT